MDKLSAQVSSALVQHLLNISAAPNSAKVTTNATTALASTTQLSLPPALRQLLAQVQQPAQLLTSLQQAQSNLSPAQRELIGPLLQSLQQNLQLNAEQLSKPGQLKQLVNDWFATSPLLAVTSPPSAPSATSSWLQQLPVAFQLMLFARLQQPGQSPAIRQLLGQALNLPTGAAFGGNPLMQLLGELFNSVKGNLNAIRLSQVQLADSGAQQQPDYYLILPYQSDHQQRQIELLLKRRRQQRDGKTEEFWLFSMRLEAKQVGTMLVKGRYANDGTQLRFYTAEQASAEWLSQQLTELSARLTAKGIEQVQLEAHAGQIPDSLAAAPHEILRVRA